MKYVIWAFILVLKSNALYADVCATQQVTFEKEEQAYDTVVRLAVAGNSAYKIISNFVKEGGTILARCPKLYSLDRQYTLKRKLKKAKQLRSNYRVFSQAEVSRYAQTHPEEIIVYKWGTIRPVP